MLDNIVIQQRPDAKPSDLRAEIERDTSNMLRDEEVQLSKRLCQLIPASDCVLVSGAAEGLAISLQACGVQVGDRVLCSGFAPSFVMRVILELGAEPMLVDINPNTLNIDPYCLDYVISKCKRTLVPVPKILVASNMFGLPCNYSKLVSICRKNDIILIEDMCQSIGAKIEERYSGSFGQFAISAFPIDGTSAEQQDGGVIFCHFEGDGELIRKLLAKSELGDNYVRACYATEWLGEYGQQIEKRDIIGAIYRESLEGVCRTQQIKAPYRSAMTQFVAALSNPQNKQEIIAKLAEQGIECTQFSPENLSGGLSEWDRVMLVHTRNAYERLISLPIKASMSPGIARSVGDIIRQIVSSD